MRVSPALLSSLLTSARHRHRRAASDAARMELTALASAAACSPEAGQSVVPGARADPADPADPVA
jgi:hypothetical protein